MAHDMTEETLRTRIRKFRDPRSNPKFRLEQAEQIVDFVEHVMLGAFEDDCEKSPECEEKDSEVGAEDDVVDAEVIVVDDPQPRADLSGPEVEVPETPAETAEPDSE